MSLEVNQEYRTPEPSFNHRGWVHIRDHKTGKEVPGFILKADFDKKLGEITETYTIVVHKMDNEYLKNRDIYFHRRMHELGYGSTICFDEKCPWK